MDKAKRYQGIDALYDKMSVAWEPYGNMVSNLPPELRKRHQRSYVAAVTQARGMGRDPEPGDDD